MHERMEIGWQSHGIRDFEQSTSFAIFSRVLAQTHNAQIAIESNCGHKIYANLKQKDYRR